MPPKETKHAGLCSFSSPMYSDKRQGIKSDHTQITYNCTGDKRKSHTVEQTPTFLLQKQNGFLDKQNSNTEPASQFIYILELLISPTLWHKWTEYNPSIKLPWKDQLEHRKWTLTKHPLSRTTVSTLNIVECSRYSMYVTAVTNRRFLTSLSPLEVNKKEIQLVLQGKCRKCTKWRLSCSQKTLPVQ